MSKNTTKTTSLTLDNFSISALDYIVNSSEHTTGCVLPWIIKTMMVTPFRF